MIKSILLIDDDRDDHHFFNIIISEMSSDILFSCAENGILALEYLKSVDVLPDLIFLDLNMPKMGGYEFLNIVRSSENLRNIPIIIYTTSNSEMDIELARKCGANMFFSKPSDLKYLEKKLNELVQKDITSDHQFELI